MAKKRFTDGLESVFEEPKDEKTKGEELLLFPVDKIDATTSTEKVKKNTTKTFTEDLQSFLQEAFNESFEEQSAEQPGNLQHDRHIKKRRRKPLSGLDTLIRETVHPKSMDLLDKPTRRLTLTFDHQKLEKLKHIARLEKTYLKDIIDEIVGEFINDYEKNKKSK